MPIRAINHLARPRVRVIMGLAGVRLDNPVFALRASGSEYLLESREGMTIRYGRRADCLR